MAKLIGVYNPQGKNFIKLYKEKDLRNCISEQQDKKDKNFPQEDKLEIRYAKIGFYKIYYIVCQCGAEANRLLVAERGLRCQNCAAFHRKETFNKLKVVIHNIARHAGDKIKITEQPMLKMKQEYERKLKHLRTAKSALRTIRAKQ